MNWLNDAWKFLNLPAMEAIDRVYHGRSVEWVAEEYPPTTQPVELQPDVHYVTVTVRRAFMPYRRVLLDRFYAAIHSSIVVRRAQEPVVLTVFSGSDNELVKLDSRAAEKVVMGDEVIAQYVPYKGELTSTIALLAIKSGAYAGALIATLKTMSSMAGVTFLGPASAMMKALISGIDFLSKVNEDKNIQVAFSGNLKPRTGTFLIAATDRSKFKWSDHTFAADYTLLANGTEAIDYPYIVLTIEAAEKRPDWSNIPALKRRGDELARAVKAAGLELRNPASQLALKVKEELLFFRLECLECAELCPPDAVRIADQAEERIKVLVTQAAASLTSARSISGPDPRFSLDDLEPFPRPLASST